MKAFVIALILTAVCSSTVAKELPLGPDGCRHEYDCPEGKHRVINFGPTSHSPLALSYCEEPIPIGKSCQLKSERNSGKIVFPTDPATTRTYWDIWITAPPCAEGLQCKMYKNMPLCLPA
ncbi:hypothetical protein TKK_0003145 [Trichogramma kaykai]|uniref:Uncharacterized protein n=1 Tax=Trichogramma kaykai TaxID=54128 RepID=A0ABD2WSL9_9HYME